MKFQIFKKISIFFSILFVLVILIYNVKFLPDTKKTIVIYNKIPKTGSTSFMHLMYLINKSNFFNIIYINISQTHNLSLKSQLFIANNISFWMPTKSFLYHGHMRFFSIHNILTSKKIYYINMIRDPLERLVSYYYFLRYGDNFRPYLHRRRQGDNKTFDECFLENGYDCRADKLWFQIPYFCGYLPFCNEPGNELALQMAKHNLINHYLIVGVSERFEDFLQLLEHLIPELFMGLSKLNNQKKKYNGEFDNLRMRKTVNKIRPSPQVVAQIKQTKIYQMEWEFYQFVLSIFDYHFKNFAQEKQPLNLNMVYQNMHLVN